MAKTKKPCPGCGQSEQYGYRDADKVCRHCQTLLAEARAAREHAAADGNVQRVAVAKRSFDWLFIHKGQGHGRGARDLFQQHFHRLVESLAGACPTDFSAKSESLLPKCQTARHCWLSRQHIESLRGLYQAAAAMVEFAYAAGKEDGESFIARLADGGATIDEFNQRSIGRSE